MIPATAKPVFNSEDAARFYEWLGHNSNEFTEIRVVNPEGTKAQSFFVKSKAEFIRVCEEWSGRFHVYAGVNPRKTTSGKTEDTTRVTAFLIMLLSIFFDFFFLLFLLELFSLFLFFFGILIPPVLNITQSNL